MKKTACPLPTLFTSIPRCAVASLSRMRASTIFARSAAADLPVLFLIADPAPLRFITAASLSSVRPRFLTSLLPFFNTLTARHRAASPLPSPRTTHRTPGTLPRPPHPPVGQFVQLESRPSAPPESRLPFLPPDTRPPSLSPPARGRCSSRGRSHAHDPAPSLSSAA